MTVALIPNQIQCQKSSQSRRGSIHISLDTFPDSRVFVFHHVVFVVDLLDMEVVGLHGFVCIVVGLSVFVGYFPRFFFGDHF